MFIKLQVFDFPGKEITSLEGYKEAGKFISVFKVHTFPAEFISAGFRESQGKENLFKQEK